MAAEESEEKVKSADTSQTQKQPHVDTVEQKAATMPIEEKETPPAIPSVVSVFQLTTSKKVSQTTPTSIVTPAKSSQFQKKQSPFVLQSQHMRVAIMVFVVALITLLIHSYRLNAAPDIFSDEGVYLLVGISIAKGLGPVVDHGIFLWHPPLYMLIEAAYIKLTGLINADTLTAVLAIRILNIFFSACTAALLVLFGHKLHSYKAGLAIAVLFLMDPYVQRIDRRNMLETLAMLFVLLGLYIFFTYRPHLTKWQRLGSGVAFGLAMLTKEAMFCELFVLAGYVVWFKRSQLRDMLWVVAISYALYLLYPTWLISIGQGNNYLSYVFFGIDRLTSSITGYRPTTTSLNSDLLNEYKPYLLDALKSRLTQYGMSYVLIAFAALFTVVLFLRFRHLIAAGYLITWSIVSFGFGILLGNISDQYFYYLIIPSIILTGYILASFQKIIFSPFPGKTSIFHRGQSIFSRTFIAYAYRIMWRPIFVVFCLMFLYNSFVWTKTYVTGSDDAYINIIKYVRANIPDGTAIEASDDVAYYYLSPSYDIRLDRDIKTISDSHIRYFIMSSKDAWGSYNAMTPQLYNWIIQNSRPLLEENDLSFWKIGVYEIKTTAVGQSDATSNVPIGEPGKGTEKTTRSFQQLDQPLEFSLPKQSLRSPHLIQRRTLAI